MMESLLFRHPRSIRPPTWPTSAPARPVGVRLIIVYKVVRAMLQLTLAMILLIGAHHGLERTVIRMAVALQEHAVHASVAALSRALLAGASHFRIVALALLLDAGLASIEAWALSRGKRWACWLVVFTTGALLPWEATALMRHAHVSRALLFVVNIAVVVYLFRRALHERARSE